MVLGQYASYVEGLARGTDWASLPSHSNRWIMQQDRADATNLRSELIRGGYDPDLYIYDERTRQFNRNPDARPGRFQPSARELEENRRRVKDNETLMSPYFYFQKGVIDKQTYSDLTKLEQTSPHNFDEHLREAVTKKEAVPSENS